MGSFEKNICLVKQYFYIFTSILLLTSCTDMKPTISAPVAQKKDSVLMIHEHKRVDPYFWMRLSDEQKTAETKDEQTQQVLNYLEAENKFTKEQLQHTEVLQKTLFDEMVGRIQKDDASVPYFKNNYWYYTRYEEGKEYPIYCRKEESLDADEQIMLDVNQLAENESYYAVRGLFVSPNNKLLAFAEDNVSRRIYTIRFKDLETGEILPDKIENTQGDGAWANDNRTFFYTSKNKVSLLSEKVWRHQLGKSNDDLVYQEKDASYYIGVYRSKSGDYIMIYNSSTTSSDYHILSTDQADGDFKQFASREKGHEYSIDHFKDKFYILSNRNAPNFQLFETSIDQTDEANWQLLIEQKQNRLLEDIEVFENHLVIKERGEASVFIKVIDQTTSKMHTVEFDDEAYVAYLGQNPEFNTPILRLGYMSMTTPYTIYDYDMVSRQKTLKKRTKVVGGHEPSDYESKRIFVEARDGEQVPVSIVYKKGFEQNGKAPLLLYAYGSYGSSTDPGFSSTRLSLLDRGFVWAIAHIRGGQEMGRRWYEDGKMFNKMNTFNDFIDVASSLIDQKYTSANHLYAMGGSAGGLLMGAVANMAPELFHGIIAAVPFVDVVSTMLDETIPLTTNEFDEWGNPKKEDSYFYMYAYSPYDQVKRQAYPHMLVTTGFFDSQVQYWEPAKWVAKLRDLKTDQNLLLLQTNMDAGHGGASGRFKRYYETALEYAFLLDLEGITQ